MNIVVKSPFKCNKIEDDPENYGIRVEQVKDSIISIFNNISLLISGPRGIGKSSLGAQLQNLLEGDKRLLDRCGIDIAMGSYICLFAACSKEDSLDKLVYDLISQMEEKIEEMKIRGFKFKQASFEFNLGILKTKIEVERNSNKITPTTTAGIFIEALERTVQYLYNCGINIMLDELDQLSEDINFAHFIKVVHETLYRRNIENVTFIFAGQSGLYTRLLSGQPAFERIVKHIQLDSLDDESSHYIIESACRNCDAELKIEPEAEKMILSIASGYPYTIHLLGHESFNQMLNNYEKIPKIGLMIEISDILMGIDRILTNKRERYFDIIDTLNYEEKSFVYSISTKSTKNIPITYTVENLVDSYVILKDAQRDEVIDKFDKLIKSLENKKIIKEIAISNEEKRYIFCEELFRIFVASGLIEKKEEFKIKDELIRSTIRALEESQFSEVNYIRTDKRFL
jgi:hypothetical protein